MPAKAVQNYLKTLDSRLHGNDVKGRFKTFYETIKIGSMLNTNVANVEVEDPTLEECRRLILL